jgi:hypothetical protein
LSFRISGVPIWGALAIWLCGCWAPLVSLAPLAINMATGVGSAVFGVAEGAVVSAHQGSGPARDEDHPGEDHPGEDEIDREDRCEELQVNVPDVIQLRRSTTGAPEYRELSLGGELGQPQWIARIDQDTNAGGWRPAGDFLQMKFIPPLVGPIPSASSNYLAYRDMQSESSAAEERLEPLSLNFGHTVGTFTSNGRMYQYALTHTLPCFASPP